MPIVYYNLCDEFSVHLDPSSKQCIYLEKWLWCSIF